MSTRQETNRALYSAEQIKRLEQNYAEISGKPTYQLMKRAGQALFNAMVAHFPKARKILIVAGKGNNGGDGIVVATLAAKHRLKVTLWLVGNEFDLKGDAKKAYQALPHSVSKTFTAPEVLTDKGSDPRAHFDVIVDAILGTGIKGAVRKPYLQAIQWINRSQLPVISADLPSGLEADTGAVYNHAVKAELTVTFVGIKQGLLTGQSANHVGHLILDSLGIDEAYFESLDFNLFSHDYSSIRHLLKPRKPVCHKGDFGHVVIIGGNQGYAGAAALASAASLKSGAGLTSAWVDPASVTPIICRSPEVMARAVLTEQIDSLVCKELLLGKTLVLGPGLGQDDWAKHWLKSFTENKIAIVQPQVWDADALNLLSQSPNINPHRILTPHPGEAARLLQTDTQEINRDRFSAACEIARQYGGVCILKGAGTVIANERGFQIVCPVGNSGMASGGMGDVLAGLIGSLLAQGHSLMDAAVLGVCIHGESAERLAGVKNRTRGMAASELIEHFRELIN